MESLRVNKCTLFTLSLSLSFQVCGVEFDRKDINMNKLVVSCLEGKYHVFDLRTQHPTKGFAQLTEKVSSPAVSCEMRASCNIRYIRYVCQFMINTTAIHAKHIILYITFFSP